MSNRTYYRQRLIHQLSVSSALDAKYRKPLVKDGKLIVKWSRIYMYVFLGLIFILCAIATLFALLKIYLLMLIFSAMAVILAGFTLFLSSFRQIVDDNTIVISYLYIFKKKIYWSEITHAMKKRDKIDDVESIIFYNKDNKRLFDCSAVLEGFERLKSKAAQKGITCGRKPLKKIN